MKRLFIPLMLLICAGIASGQISYPKGSMSGPVLVANLPAIGNSNLLYDVRDASTAGTCATGGGTVRVICHWTGSAYAVVAGADVSGNVIANNFVPGFATTATAATTTTLTVASKGIQAFTGVTTQTVVLPVVTTLPQTGFGFVIQNDSSGALTVNSSGGNLVQTMAAGTRANFTCKLLTGTTAASWNVTYLPATFGITNTAPSGTVPKSIDGSGNLGASQITDDGSIMQIGSVDVGIKVQTTGLTQIGDGGHVDAYAFVDLDNNQAALFAGTGAGVYFEAGAEADFGAPVINITSTAKTNLDAATGVNTHGTNTNDNAAAGYVGELLTASLASGSATSLSTGTAKTVISISLTAGDWEVTGSVQYVPAATTTTAYVEQGASLTDNTLGGEGTFTSSSGGNLSGTVLGSLLSENIPAQRFSLATTTTVYLVAKASFAISTETAYGTIRARRIR